MTDRTVHAKSASGVELVRYDKAGKWWLEQAGVRSPVHSIAQAVEAGLAMQHVYLDRPGGKVFSAKVRKRRGW